MPLNLKNNYIPILRSVEVILSKSTDRTHQDQSYIIHIFLLLETGLGPTKFRNGLLGFICYWKGHATQSLMSCFDTIVGSRGSLLQFS
ncbi:hypothetical protein ALC53_07420 [Atta colombica]|uniref:Uncharacterized protein n=1 Tax=Atta colombica TaxID=520822 RepID=A0A195BD87_9HYME|nr:hypothetical protein ALC53_07420 [Atta colombica]